MISTVLKQYVYLGIGQLSLPREIVCIVLIMRWFCTQTPLNPLGDQLSWMHSSIKFSSKSSLNDVRKLAAQNFLGELKYESFPKNRNAKTIVSKPPFITSTLQAVHLREH